MIDLAIEDEGLDVLLAGSSHPAFAENPIFRQLGFALALEKTSRETGETSRKLVELPALEALTDSDLLLAAGFFSKLVELVDIPKYPRTAAFCVPIFRALIEELIFARPSREQRFIEQAGLQLEALATATSGEIGCRPALSVSPGRDSRGLRSGPSATHGQGWRPVGVGESRFGLSCVPQR